MPLSQDIGGGYTIADIESWPEDLRVELIGGVLYHTYGGVYQENPPAMQAAPSSAHQRISANLFRQLDRFLEGKRCQVFYAPFAVYLNADQTENGDTYVEPDLVVICDGKKIDDKGCKGTPDLIIEIISPSTAKKDRIIKYQAYLAAGVPEFWLVDPETESIMASRLRGTSYTYVVSGTDQSLDVEVLEGCTVDVGKVFDLG